MSRRIAREVALQSLFQIDFNEDALDSAIEVACEEREEVRAATKAYAEELVQGVLTYKEAIDTRLAAESPDWAVERMPATDRNVLRIAVYEMFYAEPAVSAGIAINEAVEIAKNFGTDESGRFVNGILGKLARQ